MSWARLAFVSGVPVKISRLATFGPMPTIMLADLPDGDLILWLSSTTMQAVEPSPSHFISMALFFMRPEAFEDRPDFVFFPGVEKASKFTITTSSWYVPRTGGGGVLRPSESHTVML